MRADYLRHRIAIQQLKEGEDLDGYPEDTWELHHEEMAKINPLQGREYEQAQQMQAGISHKITTRFFAGANSSMRLVYGARVFNVESVINQGERNRWLEWRCEEVA